MRRALPIEALVIGLGLVTPADVRVIRALDRQGRLSSGSGGLTPDGRSGAWPGEISVIILLEGHPASRTATGPGRAWRKAGRNQGVALVQ